MADIEIGPENRSGAPGAVNLQQEISADGSAEDADRETVDADARVEQDAAQNDADVVDDGRERRDDEAIFGVLHRAEDASLVEADLCGEHEAREEYGLLEFGWGEAWGDVFHQMRGVDLAEDHQRNQNAAHHRDYRGENAPAFVFALFGDVFGEDGDEGDAERASGDQVVEEIGQSEGGVVGAGSSVGADLVGDGPIAEEAEDAAEQDASHDDAGGRGDATVEVVGRRHGDYGRWIGAWAVESLRGVFPIGRGVATAKYYRRGPEVAEKDNDRIATEAQRHREDRRTQREATANSTATATR